MAPRTAPSRRPPPPQPEPGPRHQAREVAVQVLYALDCGKTWTRESVDESLRHYWSHMDGPALGRPYGEALVFGVLGQRDRLDEAIRAANPNWRLERMARVDRNVLRVAAWEILHNPEVPSAVAIDEAIELARRFGADDAAAFVNGTLDKLARQHGKL